MSAKANASDVYTSTHVYNAQSAKANQSTTYTKTEVHDAVGTTTNKVKYGSSVRSKI